MNIFESKLQKIRDDWGLLKEYPEEEELEAETPAEEPEAPVSYWFSVRLRDEVRPVQATGFGSEKEAAAKVYEELIGGEWDGEYNEFLEPVDPPMIVTPEGLQ